MIDGFATQERYGVMDLRGAAFAKTCHGFEPGWGDRVIEMGARIRARRAAQAGAKPEYVFVESDFVMPCNRCGGKRNRGSGNGSGACDDCAAKPATCATCSSPAMHAGHCLPCANRLGMGPHPFTEGEVERRMQSVSYLADAKAKPRSTADSRALALPHPWSNCDD